MRRSTRRERAPKMQFAEVPAVETNRLAVAFWIATVDRDRIRSPVSQEAVPWPSASWAMSAATHAMAPMEATVSKLGREGSVGTAKVSVCTPTKNSTLDGGLRKWGPRTGDLGSERRDSGRIVSHLEAILADC